VLHVVQGDGKKWCSTCPNFKGFMVDNVQANYNVAHIMYGSSDPNELLVDNDCTC
jgi:hypothetical protein